MTYTGIKRIYGNQKANRVKLTEKLYDITRSEDYMNSRQRARLCRQKA